MRPPIDGGIVLLTGASSGIGLEMAKVLAPRAGRLILVARRRERLDALAAELRKINGALEVDVEACDLADLAQAAALADRLLGKYGTIDVLINNAGMGYVGLFDQNEWSKIYLMLSINISALTLLTRKLLPAMIAKKRGGILNVSSGYGYNWMPIVTAYCATKHYVTAFTEALRVELTDTGVVVSQVCPGPVPTEFDQVAETPVHVPNILKVTPDRVAETAIAGFSRGKALIVPGVIMRFFQFLGAWTPRWMLRLLYRRVGPMFRSGARIPLVERVR
jgi:uncharacterized protein